MPEIKTYADNPAVAAEFAKYLCDWINAQPQEKITVSLSGGSTPKLLFQVLASEILLKPLTGPRSIFSGVTSVVLPPTMPKAITVSVRRCCWIRFPFQQRTYTEC